MSLLYKEESYQIKGACFWIWKEFGSAFKESVIENALIKEFKRRGLEIQQQKRIDIYYLDEKVGIYVADIIVNDLILIEIKCKPFITKEDERQFWRYLKCSQYKLGFLINFGSRGLEIERRIYEKAREKSSNKNRSATDPRRRSARGLLL